MLHVTIGVRVSVSEAYDKILAFYMRRTPKYHTSHTFLFGIQLCYRVKPLRMRFAL